METISISNLFKVSLPVRRKGELFCDFVLSVIQSRHLQWQGIQLCIVMKQNVNLTHLFIRCATIIPH